MVKAVEFVIWCLVGVLVLLRNTRPTKLEYGLLWACLMIRIVI